MTCVDSVLVSLCIFFQVGNHSFYLVVIHNPHYWILCYLLDLVEIGWVCNDKIWQTLTSVIFAINTIMILHFSTCVFILDYPEFVTLINVEASSSLHAIQRPSMLLNNEPARQTKLIEFPTNLSAHSYQQMFVGNNILLANITKDDFFCLMLIFFIMPPGDQMSWISFWMLFIAFNRESWCACPLVTAATRWFLCMNHHLGSNAFYLLQIHILICIFDLYFT